VELECNYAFALGMYVHKEMFFRNINRVNVSLDILNTFLFIRFLPDVLAGFVEFLGSWAKIQP